MATRRKFLVGSSLAVCGLLAGCGSSDVAPLVLGGGGGLPDPALLSRQLQQDVQYILDVADVPGAAVGVWTPSGSWVQAFGRARVDPDRPLQVADIFALRSVTKSFTVTLILQLVREGRIQLDQPISTFVSGVPAGDQITLRHLAGMTSGLTDYTASRGFAQLTTLEQFLTLDELIAFSTAEPLKFTPGSRYDYCNANTLLLGKVVEVVTGQPFGAVLQTRILDPLSMRQTAYFQGVELPDPSTRGYAFDEGAFEELRVNYSLFGPAGAMFSTLADARVWARALSSGSLIGLELQAERMRGLPAVNGPIYDRYGLGMGEIQGWWGHTGEGLGYAVALFGEPLSGSAVVILLNGSNTHDMPARMFRRFLSTLGWAIPTPPDART